MASDAMRRKGRASMLSLRRVQITSARAAASPNTKKAATEPIGRLDAAAKLFLVGMGPEGRLSFFERTFNRCMGLWADRQTLWMSSLYQMWRFENALEAGQTHNGYDSLYVPQVGYITGDLDIHDISVDRKGRLVFVNTLFGCLATVSETHSFQPLWRPPFLSKLAAEDRCHLNGLAMEDGEPAYVTACSRSDVADGWREARRDGGVVVDVRTDKVVAEGLSMPHSPRVHGGQLYVIEAGSGYLCRIEPETGTSERIAFCPGYARGLCFVGDFAVVGLSKLRENRTFADLELGENLETKQAQARCALHVIDLRSGDTVHFLRIDGVVEELYDVVAIPGVRRPMAIGFTSDEIRRVISVDDGAS